MSSTGSTIPVPKNWPQRRFVAAFAKYGFDGAVSHSASVARGLVLNLNFGVEPSRNVAWTMRSVFGMVISLRSRSSPSG